jgi:putative oxidoreductase
MENYFLITNSFLVHSAILLLRVFIGGCFIVHGLGKLGVVGTGNLAGFTAWLKSLGVPLPHLQARAAMLAEIIGGASILLGCGMRIGALLCFFMMIMAGLLGHKGAGYLITNNPPGAEYTLNLAIICVALFLMGPGAFSVDALLFQP